MLLGSQCLPNPSMVTRCLHHGWVVGDCSFPSRHCHMFTTHLLELLQTCHPKYTLMLPNQTLLFPMVSTHSLFCRLSCTSPQLSMSPCKVAARHGEHAGLNNSVVFGHWDMY